MDKQRNEDLNPGSEDIEEKIKRMLDPSLPDEPMPDKLAPTPVKPKKSTNIIAVSPLALANPEDQNISTIILSEVPATPSAPELPSEILPSLKVKSKKFIIPISHHEEIVEEQPKTKKPDSEIQSKKSSETKLEPRVKKISIADNNNSTEVVAEKLDEAIAELDKQKIVPKAKTENLETTAELESANSSPVQEDVPTVDQAETDDKIAESEVISDPSTDKAVEDIVAAEGDELLEIEDAVRDTDVPIKPGKKPRTKFLQKLKALWAKPNFRWAVLAGVTLLIISISLVPGARYYLLNSAGVRAKSSLVVLDQSTRLPLKNVTVALGEIRGVTDEEGRVTLEKLELGSTKLKIEKRAFASIDKNIVVGLGSNPLGDYSLTPTGSQYSFTVIDYLSGKPVDKAEASSGEASAVSDEKGVIKLTIDNRKDDTFQVIIKSDSYRSENLTIDPNDISNHTVKLVPAKKHVFVSKRSGKFDIFSVYVDGKDEKLAIEGSGNEKEGMVLVPHTKDDVIAYVSTRGGQNNSDGFLLSNLILLNTSDNVTTNVAMSERIQIVEWFGDYLVYVQIASGSSANSPKRYRLISYNYKDGSSKELASSNYFNDVMPAKGAIYYAPASAYQSSSIGLLQINPDGSNQRTVYEQEVWNIFRTSYDDLALSVQQNWYNYQLGENLPSKLNTAPANQLSRVYIGSPDGSRSAWVDIRDGKGVLINHENLTNKDTNLTSQSGLKHPVSWLNDSTLIYRIKTDRETADYAISIDGGEPVKITDVTNSGGLDRWNY